MRRQVIRTCVRGHHPTGSVVMTTGMTSKTLMTFKTLHFSSKIIIKHHFYGRSTSRELKTKQCELLPF
jgi:hypothetical protein